MTLSNITSASAGEASVSSGSHTDHEYDGNDTSTPPPPRSMTSTPATTVSSGQQQQPPLAAAGSKRKRNLPGTPDPEAEVIALSPTTLMATNRFVCEICNKGFQRDQNLQLHRRGHNLPWKLRQRSSKEIRKRVYICPEPSCVHHDPSRALGDLTGIKKHFCRKHGEKKWKCDKCSKRYAVQSDWKAHSKTCGTREYRCDCGTLFSRQELVQQIAHGKKCAWHVGNGESRRDSFITHRAFCDALAEDSARVSAAGKRIGGGSDMSSSDMVVQVIGPAAASTMSVIGGGGAAAAAPSSPHTNNLGAAAVSGGDHNSLAASAGAGGGGSGGSPMRSGLLPPSMAASLGRLDEGGLSLLPPQWGSHQAVVGNAPAATTAGAAGPRLSLWLGGPAGGPGQGLPGSQQMQLQQLPGCSDIASSYLMQPPKAIMHLGGGGGTGMQGIPNHALQEYDVPQAPRPLSSSELLLPMVSSGSTTGSLFAHLVSSAGMSMPGFHATGAASMGMGISGFSDFMTGVNQTERSSATAGLSLSSAAGLSSCSSSVYNDGVGNLPSMSMLFNQQQLQHHHTATAQMSATALLQKAAQMGATASNSSSLLRGFGFGGGDSSSMSLWQGQRQEPAHVGDQLPPPNKPSIVQPLQSRRSVEVPPMQTGSPVVVGTSMGPSSFGGSQGRPNEHHEAARIQDFRNSLSGGAGIFAGSLSNMSSMFRPNATPSTGNVGGMMPPSNNRHRMSTNDVMGGHHRHSPYSGAPVSQGMGPSLLPVGLGGGGSTRAEDGSDRFTHDFLGVGGANGMAAAAVAAAAAAAGGMGRTLSQCDLASITSLGPGVDLGAFFTQRENLRSVGASGHSPGKSWDSS